MNIGDSDMRETYFITHNLNDIQKQDLLKLFETESWTKGRTLKDIEAAERTCLFFGVIEKATDTLVAFTRVLTDDVKYAYIHDVIVEENHRGKGLGRYMMEAVLSHPRFKNIVCFELLCLADNIPFYNKFHFQQLSHVFALRYDKRKQ